MRIDRNYKDKVKTIENLVKNGQNIGTLDQIKELFWYANRAWARLFLNKMVRDWLLEIVNKKYLPTSLISAYPLFDAVRAWLPFTPYTETQSQIELNKFLIEHPSSTFFVRIKWDSMCEAWIVEWDIAIVDRSLNPKNGDIIIASLDWDVTIKYYEKNWTKIRLIPANNKYSPIVINSQAEILGVVTWTIRKYS